MMVQFLQNVVPLVRNGKWQVLLLPIMKIQPIPLTRKGLGVWIVTLGMTTISASTAASRVVSPGDSTLLVVSVLFVSLCSRDPFNGALEVGA